MLSLKSTASIIRCFNWVEQAERNVGTSDLSSFANHNSWERVRHFAGLALDEIGVERGRPDLGHISYID